MEVNIQDQIPSVKLIKGQKDSYGWEIKLFGKDMDKLLEELKQVNDQLKKDFSEGKTE